MNYESLFLGRHRLNLHGILARIIRGFILAFTSIKLALWLIGSLYCWCIWTVKSSLVVGVINYILIGWQVAVFRLNSLYRQCSLLGDRENLDLDTDCQVLLWVLPNAGGIFVSLL